MPSIQSATVVRYTVQLILRIVLTLMVYKKYSKDFLIDIKLLEFGAKSLKFAMIGILTLVLIFSRLIAEL